MSNDRVSYSGIGFLGTLTLIFVTLKLLGVISWSWWWVLSPILLHFGLVVLILIGIGLYVFFRK